MEIALQSRRIVSEARLSEYRRAGGITDPQIDHEKMIRELGPRIASARANQFVELRAMMKRFYGLNPTVMRAHLQLVVVGSQRGWFRRGTPSPRS